MVWEAIAKGRKWPLYHFQEPVVEIAGGQNRAARKEDTNHQEAWS